MSKLKEFVMASARPLPVIILADISGSMSTNGKIDALNDAIRRNARLSIRLYDFLQRVERRRSVLI